MNNIQNELEEPFNYSWNLVYILLIIIVILIVVYILIKLSPFFSKLFGKFFRKAATPSLKVIYIKRLEKLKALIQNNEIDNRNAYLQLSNTIREFIEKTTGINVLSISKKEAKKLNMKELSLLMEEYYPPEFSKNSKGDILVSIARTIEVIKRWN